MGHSDAVDLLRRSLEDEKSEDRRLTEIAENLANSVAQQERSARHEGQVDDGKVVGVLTRAKILLQVCRKTGNRHK
jgi:hypothetical protein